MTAGLDGARVLVVGASSGIGRATAAAFAEAGADVVAASRGGDRLTAAAQEIGARAAVLDTGDGAAVEAFFAGEAPFDHVAISAAETRIGAVAELPLEDAAAAMESKFWGAYRVARAARIAPGGSLTLVSGVYAVRPEAGAALQGAINAGLEALARGLALELAPVRVNTVSPGLIDTPMFGAMAAADRADMFGRCAARLPVGRTGRPEDVAAAVLFLAASPYATGSTVTVDGGASIA